MLLNEVRIMEGRSDAEGRRAFLRTAALGGLALLAPSAARAARTLGERRLDFFNTHTGESVSAVYWADGEYVAEGIEAINKVLRDHRTGDRRAMDRRLLDLLHDLRRKLDTDRPFHVISGYRSPKTNEMLRSRPGSGVAKASQHMLARATDLRVPGRKLEQVRAAAVALKRGGVGYYPGPQFVHVDVGRVRYW